MSLLEQDVTEVEETDVEKTDVEKTDVEVKEEPPDPAWQSIAELIVAAFAYPPTDDDSDAIKEIELLLVGTHNEAPPVSNIRPRKVIQDIVDRLPDQLRDVYPTGPGRGADLEAVDEIYLAQILADAFRYRPTPGESHIASTVHKELYDNEAPDPTAVIETIQRLIQFSDESVEDELLDIRIDTE